MEINFDIKNGDPCEVAVVLQLNKLECYLNTANPAGPVGPVPPVGTVVTSVPPLISGYGTTAVASSKYDEIESLPLLVTYTR